MSYIFINESENFSKEVTKAYKKSFEGINQVAQKGRKFNPSIKKLKAETTSPEEMFDVESFHNDIEEQGTTTGSVGGTFVGSLSSGPIKKSSLFAPEGSSEHKQGKKILKQMEKPKVFTKKSLEESFLVSEEDIEEQGTTTGSVGGSYVQPGIWAKDKSNWRGNKKLYPGGKFVHPKEKCKTFPYCDESPEAIELTDKPMDKIDNLFTEDGKKYTYDLSDNEMWRKRDSDYIKLVEILNSVQNLRQITSVERLVDLFYKKFDGYVSKHLKKSIDDMLNTKREELKMGVELEENRSKVNKLTESKGDDLQKIIKTINSTKNVGQFNTSLKTMINFRVKHGDNLTKEDVKQLNDALHIKVKELVGDKKEIKESLKPIHNKIND